MVSHSTIYLVCTMVSSHPSSKFLDSPPPPSFFFCVCVSVYMCGNSFFFFCVPIGISVVFFFSLCFNQLNTQLTTFCLFYPNLSLFCVSLFFLGMQRRVLHSNQCKYNTNEQHDNIVDIITKCTLLLCSRCH
jgi:hypothetical protein